MNVAELEQKINKTFKLEESCEYCDPDGIDWDTKEECDMCFCTGQHPTLFGQELLDFIEKYRVIKND